MGNILQLHNIDSIIQNLHANERNSVDSLSNSYEMRFFDEASPGINLAYLDFVSSRITIRLGSQRADASHGIEHRRLKTKGEVMWRLLFGLKLKWKKLTENTLALDMLSLYSWVFKTCRHTSTKLSKLKILNFKLFAGLKIVAETLQCHFAPSA